MRPTPVIHSVSTVHGGKRPIGHLRAKLTSDQIVCEMIFSVTLTGVFPNRRKIQRIAPALFATLFDD
jgi:hypothetical protein